IGQAQLGGETVMLSSLRAHVREGGEAVLLTLYGVSSETDDPVEAAVRSTLDAANRIFR
ncbi:MAG: hypothetical protein IMX01_10610, partial [Limnochordaceae bacterium]|nr:hypothetical protein [Limnochordaceae bacterium]